MSVITPTVPARVIDYPESDGKPMADNTKQFRWISVLQGNIAAIYHDREDVFVGGNLLWYPVEHHPEINAAPDVFAVFGRPKGDRRSYKQWEENGIPLTVAFEVLSPGNTAPEMVAKFAFYDDYGVEEYYVYNPDNNFLQAFVRRGDVLVRVRMVDGYVSPRLGIRFDFSGPEMVVVHPDGRPFRSFEELYAESFQAAQQARDAMWRAQNAEQRADGLQRRADRLAELMRRVLAQQATADELEELRQLLEQPPSS